MLEVHRDVIGSDVGSHGDDWCRVELTDQMSRRDTVKVRHDDVHQDHVILGTSIEFIDSF